MIRKEQYLQAKQIIEEYEAKDNYPSFWYMRDGHSFIKITGDDINEVKINFIKTAKENPYGMVCPVIIMKEDKELRRVGQPCHVDGKGNVDISKWLTQILKEECIRNYKIRGTTNNNK